ncbi:pyridoxal phosphate-dependent aminotransferase [Halospeciosus flavus]|uniref:pyridoxal phosphate-dependent aminotransferase n=1 Tax=Halospeciosus flavus TaxID=3032283 RepID=UPI00360B2FC8
MELTDRVTGIEASKIREMFDLAEEAEGDLVRLEVGEPDFDTPEHVVDAATRAAREGETHYTANAGLPELRAAIADSLATDRDVHVDPDTEVCVTAGGMEALHLTLLCVASDGDEVVVPSPLWPNYFAQARLADATPVEVPLPEETGYALDADRIIEAINDDTAAVMLNSPSNPTGRVHDPADLRAVVEAAADHDAYVVADEVYMGLTYDVDPASVASLVDTDNVVLIDSCSKRYAMTGWRIGWLAGPEEVVSAATKIHESTSSCASSVSQHAAIAALTGPDEVREEMQAAFAERRDLVAERIDAIEESPARRSKVPSTPSST